MRAVGGGGGGRGSISGGGVATGRFGQRGKSSMDDRVNFNNVKKNQTQMQVKIPMGGEEKAGEDKASHGTKQQGLYCDTVYSYNGAPYPQQHLVV